MSDPGFENPIVHFATRQPLIGEIYNNYSFYFKTRRDNQRGPTWCNGNVGWNGTVSQINLVFSGGTLAPQSLLTIGGILSFAAILIGFLVVFMNNAPLMSWPSHASVLSCL
jgi:hypothetical protein